MLTLITKIVLICSFLGIVVILFRKIPLLLQLPKTEMISEPFSLRLKNKIKSWQAIKFPPLETFLQKLISKFRIFALKTDSKTANWLRRLRERSLKKKNLENDNYWQEVKKSADEDKNPPPTNLPM
jgi:hypothetical protein